RRPRLGAWHPHDDRDARAPRRLRERDVTATLSATVPSVVPEHERRLPRIESYAALVARLSRQSVTEHFDAYADVDWDAADSAIDHADPRWEQPEGRPLGDTAWYRALPQPTRARLGLHLIATQVKLGLEFERVLKQGLLEFASTLPHDAPEFRYAYHEVIEETQHSLMFRELLMRIDLDVR